jgi:hypothetical protein
MPTSTNWNKFTVAYEILTTKEEFANGSFEIETKDESEVGNQGVIAALTAMRCRIAAEELPTMMLILCVNSLLANSLPHARHRGKKSRVL